MFLSGSIHLRAHAYSKKVFVNSTVRNIPFRVHSSVIGTGTSTFSTFSSAAILISYMSVTVLPSLVFT